MERIGVRELRQHASRYLAKVESGQSIAVTSRGRLVAVLQPPGDARSERDRLISQGLLRPASQSTGRLRSPQPVHVLPSEPTNAQLLDDERGDRL